MEARDGQGADQVVELVTHVDEVACPNAIIGCPVGCTFPDIMVVMSVFRNGGLLHALLPVTAVPPPPPITVFLGPRPPGRTRCRRLLSAIS